MLQIGAPEYVVASDLTLKCFGRPTIGSALQPRYRLQRLRGLAHNLNPAQIDGFVLGVTRPDATTTGVPVGSNLTDINTDTTIASGQTVIGMRFNAYVNFTDSTSRAINCEFNGRAPGGTFHYGAVNGNNGGYIERCTIHSSAAGAIYYRNGIDGAGPWTAVRNDFSRCVDMVHVTGGNPVTLQGNYAHDFLFFDGSSGTDHPTDALHPGWTHNDFFQRLGGSSVGDLIEGNNILGYFDATLGTPQTAINGGYPNRNYSNLITYSNQGGYTGVTIRNNWLDGGSYPSGMVQFTTGTGNGLTFSGNRFGLGGAASSGKKIFLATWPAGTAVTLGSANVYDDLPNVPSAWRGQPIAGTTAGYSVTLP